MNYRMPILAVLCLFLTCSVFAQGSHYLFKVDMRYADLQAGDRVIVRGSGATLGNWLGADLVLEKKDQHHQGHHRHRLQ